MRIGRVAIALLAGALVALVVYQASLARVRDEEAVPVLVAARDLAARTVITGDAVRTVSIPRHLVPPGALRSSDDAQRRVPRDPIFAGEVIIDRHLAAPGGEALSASALVPEGKPYAFNLPVALFLSPPPRLQVHDRIDVVAYPRGRSLAEGGVIVSDLEIVDISARGTDSTGEPVFLTVGATAQEIVRILASREGFTLVIALRPFIRQ